MKKLLPLLLSTLLLSNITQTYASPSPYDTGHDESFKNAKFFVEMADAQKIKGITVTENELPKIISRLFLETVWTANSKNGCAVKIPKIFNPSPFNNQLINVEALGISKIDVKIYNNWGIQVAESTLIGENHLNYASKKLSLTQNELNFNQDMKEGTYYYVLDICCINGKKTVKEGEIRLFKKQKNKTH
jgi:hypothetical protein